MQLPLQMGSQLRMSFSREQGFGIRTQPTAKPNLKPNKPRQPNQQGHFDPEELTRRLYVVLADRKAHEERKRSNRQQEEAKLKDARSWTSRHHNKEAAARRSKEAKRETATTVGQPSRQTSSSVKPGGGGGSTSSEKQRKDSSKDAQRPKPEPAPAATYHHIPREAAKQFQRTTTVETMRDSSVTSSSSFLSHKLSKQALKLHLAAASSSHHHPTSTLPAIPDESTMSPVVDRHIKAHSRVDEWRSRIPEDPTIIINPVTEEDDDEREEYHLAPLHQHLSSTSQQDQPQPQPQPPTQEHTFAAELARLRPHPEQQHIQNRRNSTGDILHDRGPELGENSRLSMVIVGRTSLADVLESPTPPLPEHTNPDEHRVDWTQSDEAKAAAAAAAAASSSAAEAAAAQAAASPPAAAQRQHKPLLSPLLRKADSIWTLRGRLGSRGQTSAGVAVGDMPAVPEGEDAKSSPGSKGSRSPKEKEAKSPKQGKEPRSPIGGLFAKFKR